VIASGEFTMEAVFKTANLEQTGPARILGCSLDGMQRNFSLCQEETSIRFRLRTTDTGKNGTKPELVIARLGEASGPQHVLVTYKEDTIGVYVNGRKIRKELSGKLTNWNNIHPVIVGNEFKDDRPWAGTVYMFSLTNRYLDETAAQTRFKQSGVQPNPIHGPVRKKGRWKTHRFKKHKQHKKRD
jgi:hypothetical protein